MVGESAVVADLGESLSGTYDQVAGFLNPKVAQVFFRSHVEAGLEFPEKAAEGKMGRFGEFGDGDVVPVVLMEEPEGGAEFFVFAE